MKLRLTTAFALCTTLLSLNSYGEENKVPAKTDKVTTSSVEINITGPDGKKADLSEIHPEIEAALKKALGDDTMVQAAMKSIKAAEQKQNADGTNKTKQKGSVSVVSSAFIIGPDGKMKKLDAGSDGTETDLSSDSLDLSKLMQIFTSAIGGSLSSSTSNGKTSNTFDLGNSIIESHITDANGKEVLSFSSGSTLKHKQTPEHLELELKAIKEELAEQRKLLQQILQHLGDKKNTTP